MFEESIESRELHNFHRKSRILQDKDTGQILAALEDGSVSDHGLENNKDDVDELYHAWFDINDKTTRWANKTPLSRKKMKITTNLSNWRSLISKKTHLFYDAFKITHKPSTLDSSIANLDTPYKQLLHYLLMIFLKKL